MLINETFFFTLPLFIAGFLHHFLIIKNNLLPALAKPVDFNFKFAKRRLFGDSKTFRGFIVMALLTGFFMWLLNICFGIPLKFNSFFSGMLLGLGYSLGELPNSFFKRSLGIKESAPTPGFSGLLLHALDQTDSVIGALVFLLIIYSPTLNLIIVLFLIGTILHILVDTSLYLFGYKKGILKQ
jgi:hypothetical protein